MRPISPCQYDADGNPSSKTTPSGTTNYTYDALDRLDTESGVTGARNHDFDGNANRTTNGAGTTQTYTANTDRLATVNGVAVTLDAVGNITYDGTYRYVWDAYNQLAELHKADNTLLATYVYDEQGLRLSKVTTSAAPQGASTIFYFYDPQGHLIAETGGATLAQAQTPQMTYVWNGDKLTGVIVHQPSRVVYTVDLDHLGSPFQLRNLAGKVLWRWDTEAFGNTLPNEDVDADGNKLTLNLRFPGQYYDKESGLHYNWHRYYSPKLARYLSPDPIGLAGGSNQFSYVGGRPLSYIDPNGLAVIDAGGGRPTQTVPYAVGLGGGSSGGNIITPIRGPNYIVSPNGTVYPVPQGAQGPSPVINAGGNTTGIAYTGGQGGANGQVNILRLMNPTLPKGSSPGYPKGYIKYENSCGQGVDPYTGRTIPNRASHFTLE